MTDVDPAHALNAKRPFTWMEAPRILATFLVVGFCTLIVVGFLLGPQLGKEREEWRNTMYRLRCREAQTALSSLPAEQRLSQWQVVGRLPPNLVVIDVSALHDSHLPIRATLIEPSGEIVRTFALRNLRKHTLTDGANDYTIDSANLYLAQVESQRRRQWIIFLSVWLTSTGLLTWHFLKKPPIDGAKRAS